MARLTSAFASSSHAPLKCVTLPDGRGGAPESEDASRAAFEADGFDADERDAGEFEAGEFEAGEFEAGDGASSRGAPDGWESGDDGRSAEERCSERRVVLEEGAGLYRTDDGRVRPLWVNGGVRDISGGACDKNAYTNRQ